MSSPKLAFLAMLSLASAALGQKLDCPAPTAAAAHPCEAFHYHVLMYRPDARTFAEIYGTPQYASLAACDRARTAAMKSNLATVDFFKRVRNEQQYEPDRFGTCHCDMTIEKSSPNYLTDAARQAQMRLAEDIRLHVREKLIDAGMTTDSDFVRALTIPLSTNATLSGAKIVPMPSRMAAPPTEISAVDLRSTKVADASPSTSSIDLPLVDVPVDMTAASTISVTAGKTTTVQPPPATQPETPAPAPAPAHAPAPAPATTEAAPDPAAEEASENFIAYETQRIQNVLKASSAIADEAVKAKIFEACMQRIQLLSNLRRLIQGSGFRSRLAAETRHAKSEEDRQQFIGRLFGPEMWTHWAPKDAADVIVASKPDIESDPDGVLRNSTGRYSLSQRKHALYVTLARTQPTEDQQLWLSTLVDSFLQ